LAIKTQAFSICLCISLFITLLTSCGGDKPILNRDGEKSQSPGQNSIIEATSGSEIFQQWDGRKDVFRFDS